MPELHFFLRMKHETFRHTVGNIRDTMKHETFRHTVGNIRDTIKHETFRHTVGNIRDTMKLKNVIDTNYLTAM